MAFGLTQYILGKKRLQPAIERLAAQPRDRTVAHDTTAAAAVRVTGGLLGFSTARSGSGSAPSSSSSSSPRCSGVAYEQAGSTLNALRGSLHAARDPGVLDSLLVVSDQCSPSSSSSSRRSSRGCGFDSVLDSRRCRRSSRSRCSSWSRRSQCSCPPAQWRRQGAGVRVSPMWLVGAYAISELGELCLSPVGLSAVTKLAPVRILGLMMGVWFLSNSFGNKLAGWAAGLHQRHAARDAVRRRHRSPGGGSPRHVRPDQADPAADGRGEVASLGCHIRVL